MARLPRCCSPALLITIPIFLTVVLLATETLAGTTTYLSALDWTAMSNGWGPAERDMSNGEKKIGDGRPITLNGRVYAKGLGVHPPSDVRYALGGVCTEFQADIGIDDEVGSKGSVAFQVWADGTKLYDSGVMTGTTATKSIRVDLTGRTSLALIVTKGGDNIHYDHADWADARVTCGAPSPSPGTTYYLSDVSWTQMENGWGSVERDTSNGEKQTGDGRAITLNGKVYSKGLGAHAFSSVRYALGGVCTEFQADVGVDDESGGSGSVVFQIWLDGMKEYDSGVMTGTTATKSVRVDVTGMTELALIVTNGGDNINYDHADWADARIVCDGDPPTSSPPLPASSPGDGTVYYVATTGSDANPGTESRPFRSINRGVSELTPGDTLFIRGGTYAEEIRGGAIPGGDDWSNPVTVAAYPGETATIRPGSGTRVITVGGSGQQYIVIKGPGLILDAVNVSSEGVKIMSGAHHIRFQDVEVKNAQGCAGCGVGNGIMVQEGSDDNQFIRVNSHHNGTDKHDHGIYIRSHRNLVEGGQYWRNKGAGVHFRSGKISPTGNVVRNVTAYENAQDSSNPISPGIMVGESAKGTLVYNNLLSANGGGIRVDYGAADTKVYHNTIYGCRTRDGLVIGSATNTVARNNIVYKCGNGTRNNGSGTILSNNLVNVNPGFVDEARLDFHLGTGSPAIDRGLTLSNVNTDFDLRARPMGTASDIGAYEF